MVPCRILTRAIYIRAFNYLDLFQQLSVAVQSSGAFFKIHQPKTWTVTVITSTLIRDAL